MSGWSIVYALINFAILAVGLLLVGRKTVIKLYKDHRSSVTDSFERAEQAAVNAGSLLEGIEPAREEGERERDRILSKARDEAGENSRAAQAADESEVERLLAGSAGEARRLRAGMLRSLGAEAAEEITAAAAKLISGPEYAERRRALCARIAADFGRDYVLTPGELESFREKGCARLRLCFADEAGSEFRADFEDTLRRALTESGAGETEIRTETEVDPSLIGGVRITAGDTVYDSSVSGMLERSKGSIGDLDGVEGDVLEVLHAKLSSLRCGAEVRQIGRIASASDGICIVTGISDAMAGEMLDFGGGLLGMVMDLREGSVGVAMLGNYDDVREGDVVTRTGRVMEVPVGEALLGRVVDALGRPVDGRGELHAEGTRPIESPAPGVIMRRPVSVPMQTGIQIIDALIPIGRGQRELIIGDRQTGKTAIAVDTILNQRGKDMICVYVAIGQKESTVASVVDRLERSGAMDYTVVVCANASEPAPLLYAAPYSGAAIGEYFMYGGRDVLIIYDDLSKHAVAYREISLLLHRPPGREAYPGDVFYLHSRLLERAARLNEEAGGGSMTALPIVETQAGDISAYIPTNVISITDGQIFLETELFNSGVRPAVNAGLSVSRVGGAAQLGAMKQVAGRLRMELAQYRELAAFSQFGSDLDKATRATLCRGDRITELLKQPQYSPMSAADQVIAIFAGSEGFCDGIELRDVTRFEKEMIAFVHRQYPEFESLVDSGKKLTKEQLDRLRAVIADFAKDFGAV